MKLWKSWWNSFQIGCVNTYSIFFLLWVLVLNNTVSSRKPIGREKNHKIRLEEILYSSCKCNKDSLPLINQVSLKSPDVMLMLPIHIGNVSLDKKLRPSKKAAQPSSPAAEDVPVSTSTPDSSTSTSATTPTVPPRSAPKPAPRPAPRSRMSSHNSPSAPPAEYHQGAEGGNDGFPNKRQSQLVSPNAFSYAPGLFFPQNQQPNGPGPAPNQPVFSGSTVTTAPYPPEGASSMPAPLILPPDYGSSTYPQGQLVHTHFHPGSDHGCRLKCILPSHYR